MTEAFGCGEALCKVSPPRKGETGLILTWITFDTEKQKPHKVSGFLKGKKGSRRTEVLRGAFVASDSLGICLPYLFLRHVYDDREPLYVFGLIKREEESGKPSFEPIREFRASIDQLPNGKVAILDGPFLICECRESFFIGRIIHSKRKEDYRLKTDRIQFPEWLPSKRKLVHLSAMRPSNRPHAVFIAEKAPPPSEPPEEWANPLATHFLQKERVLRNLQMKNLRDGGKALVSSLTSPKCGWYLVPLTRDSTPVEEYDMLIDSPLYDDLPTAEAENWRWNDIPNCFAALHSVSCIARDDSEDANQFFSTPTTRNYADSSYYLGTLSKYLLEFRNGQLIACSPLPHVPVSITLANCFAGHTDAVLLVQYGDKTLQVLNRNFEVLKDFADVESVIVGDFFRNGLEQLYIIHSPSNGENESQGKQKSASSKRKRNDTTTPEQRNTPFTLTDLAMTITTIRPSRGKRNAAIDLRGKGKAKIRYYSNPRNEVSTMSLQNVAYSLYSQMMRQQKAKQAASGKVSQKDALIEAGCAMLASLNNATRNMWHCRDAESIANHLVPLFPESKEEQGVGEERGATYQHRECPLSFSELSHWTNFHADVSKLFISFSVTNIGNRAVECLGMILGSLSVRTCDSSGWLSHCSIARSEDHSERSGTMILPGETASFTTSVSLKDIQGHAVDATLWMEVWVNEEQEDSANDYNMWPYERPEDIAVEIYFVGAVLLDTTALLFGRPEEPLQLTASSYPYEFRVLVPRLTGTFPRFDPSVCFAKLFPPKEPFNKKFVPPSTTTTLDRRTQLAKNMVTHTGNGFLLLVDKDTSLCVIRAASPWLIAHLLPALCTRLPPSVWTMPDASAVLLGVWRFALALEEELRFIRDWVLEERRQTQSTRREEEEAEGFTLSAKGWKDLLVCYTTEQIASELRFYLINNNMHLQ